MHCLSLERKGDFTHTNSDALFHLYQSLVCPHLEYASSVWSPYRTGEIKALEDVHKFAFRICKDLGSKLSITFRIVPDSHTWGPMNLPGLVHYVQDCTYNPCYFPSHVLCEHHATRTTRATLGRPSHPSHLHFHCPSFHTTQFPKSFIMRSISVELIATRLIVLSFGVLV